MSRSRYLYIHVPFCRSICGYCDFVHSVYQRNLCTKWLDAVQLELDAKKISEDLVTIYIGGGTPSCLGIDELRRLLEVLKPYATHVKEYTIEVNPETLDEEKADLFREYGINRVSLGFETSDASLLEMMNRHHTFEDVKDCVALLKQRNIDNISLDLMYSLPSQSMDSLKRSLQDALSLSVPHLSLYSLTIEEHTAFYAKGYAHLDEDTEADMYEYISVTLEANGYHQYEVSNFCLEGYESIHNSAYWNYEDFIGISAGASGKEDDIRYEHTHNLAEYCKDPLHLEFVNEEKKEIMFNMIMMSLRLKRGMDIALFDKKYETNFLKEYGAKIEPLIIRGLVEIKEGYFRCTDAGFAVMNSVLVELM